MALSGWSIWAAESMCVFRSYEFHVFVNIMGNTCGRGWCFWVSFSVRLVHSPAGTSAVVVPEPAKSSSLSRAPHLFGGRETSFSHSVEGNSKWVSLGPPPTIFVIVTLLDLKNRGVAFVAEISSFFPQLVTWFWHASFLFKIHIFSGT